MVETYSDTLLDHFRRPRNVGVLEHADAEAHVESEVHGDRLRLGLTIEDGRIVAARFLCRGCPVAIAAGSVATELLVGRTVAEARSLTDAAVIEALGGVPESKRACSVLVQRALAQALGR